MNLQFVKDAISEKHNKLSYSLALLLRISQGHSQGVDWGLDSYLRLPVSPQVMWSLGELSSLQL